MERVQSTFGGRFSFGQAKNLQKLHLTTLSWRRHEAAVRMASLGLEAPRDPNLIAIKLITP
jgi:hypothetical protein